MTLRNVLVAVFLAALAVGRVEAQSGGVYSLSWNTLGGGGQTFGTGGAYVIGGTAGQPDAGQMSGAAYSLQGGFWAPTAQPTVDAPVTAGPLVFAARTPSPNPFRSTTVLAFDLPTTRTVRLVLHAVDGRIVRRLADGEYGAGRHQVIWDGRDDRGRLVASGIYFARLVAGEFKSTHRIVRLD